MEGIEIRQVGSNASVGLGELLDLLVARSGRKVTEVVREAQISRAYFYVMRDGNQTPSLESLVRVLSALDAELQTGDPEDGEPDLVVRSADDEWSVQLHYVGKSAARARGVREVSYADKLSTRPPMSPAPAPSRSTFVVAASDSAARTPRQSQLLSELVTAAARLDDKRLQLLVANAQMLADPNA